MTGGFLEINPTGFIHNLCNLERGLNETEKEAILIEKHGHPHKEVKDIGITLWEKIGLKKRWEELQSNSREMNDSLSHLHSFSKVTLSSQRLKLLVDASRGFFITGNPYPQGMPFMHSLIQHFD